MLKLVGETDTSAPVVNEHLLKMLAHLNEMALSGKLRGMVALINHVESSASFATCGTVNTGSMLLAFEGWKMLAVPQSFSGGTL